MANPSTRRRVGGGSKGGASSRSSRSRRLRRVLLVAAFVVASMNIALLLLHSHSPPPASMMSPAASSNEDASVVGVPLPPSLLRRVDDSDAGRGGSSVDNLEAEGEGDEPIVIAHAISLIKCSKGPSVTGFLDAAAVLRHSIHKNSVHYVPPVPRGGNSTSSSRPSATPPSRYSYQMYGIVHPTCGRHAAVLERLGYKIMIRDHPVKKDDIRGEWLRNHVEGENCCGSAEFIKLYAYHLTDHPVVVHWDMDVAVLRPMDDLYDVMIYPSDHPRHVAARSSIELQHPYEEAVRGGGSGSGSGWPDRVDAFLTRDVTSSQPWETRTGVQGGFLVARPDASAFDAYVGFITEGDYVGGRGDGSGWAGLGYGGFQGAMAYQGAVAYYYDQLRPGTAVELDVCRWNQVAADVIWRGPARREEHGGQCREHPRAVLADGMPDYAGNTPENGRCEDCRNTPVESVRTAHYTACKKPWECKLATPRVPRDRRQVYRLENLVNVTYCMALVREWFELRREFEDALEAASDGAVRPSPRSGRYQSDHFLGYCNRDGGYIAIEPPPEDFDIKRIYGM